MPISYMLRWSPEKGVKKPIGCWWSSQEAACFGAASLWTNVWKQFVATQCCWALNELVMRVRQQACTNRSNTIVHFYFMVYNISSSSSFYSCGWRLQKLQMSFARFWTFVSQTVPHFTKSSQEEFVRSTCHNNIWPSAFLLLVFFLKC